MFSPLCVTVALRKGGGRRGVCGPFLVKKMDGGLKGGFLRKMTFQIIGPALVFALTIKNGSIFGRFLVDFGSILSFLGRFWVDNLEFSQKGQKRRFWGHFWGRRGVRGGSFWGFLYGFLWFSLWFETKP